MNNLSLLKADLHGAILSHASSTVCTCTEQGKRVKKGTRRERGKTVGMEQKEDREEATQNMKSEQQGRA